MGCCVSKGFEFRSANFSLHYFPIAGGMVAAGAAVAVGVVVAASVVKAAVVARRICPKHKQKNSFILNDKSSTECMQLHSGSHVL